MRAASAVAACVYKRRLVAALPHMLPVSTPPAAVAATVVVASLVVARPATSTADADIVLAYKGPNSQRPSFVVLNPQVQTEDNVVALCTSVVVHVDASVVVYVAPEQTRIWSSGASVTQFRLTHIQAAIVLLSVVSLGVCLAFWIPLLAK